MNALFTHRFQWKNSIFGTIPVMALQEKKKKNDQKTVPPYLIDIQYIMK